MSTSGYSAGEPSLNEPQLVSVAYRGMEYRGEIEYSDSWNPDLGRPLTGDAHFRIVLLSGQAKVDLDSIRNSRIAVCIPGRGRSRSRRDLDREFQAVRETRSLYATRGDAPSGDVRRYIDEQERELETRARLETGERYAAGSIQSHSSLGHASQEIFSGSDPEQWYRSLGSDLLAWAYSTTYLDLTLLPRPLAPQDFPSLFRAIVGDSPEDRASLVELGPGLGISRPGSPLDLDLSECRIFGLIREAMDRKGTDVGWN